MNEPDNYARALAATAVAAVQIGTPAVAATKQVPAPVVFLRTTGGAVDGDGGAANYRRVGAAPSHPAKFQSKDGAWWELAERVVTPVMLGAIAAASDHSTVVQNAATAAKALGAELCFGPISGAGLAYKVNNVDVAGLKVSAAPGVTLAAPSGATGWALVAIGTSGSRITKPTVLRGLIHAGGGSQAGLFQAQYANDVLVEDCYGSGYPTNTDGGVDGQAVSFNECIRPRVRGGRYTDGRSTVAFESCTNPVVEGVKTENSGRDGVLFHTNPLGTLTTDAVAMNVFVDGFCLNGEEGRGGIHFYGVRRAMAIGCRARNDNGQTFNDTGCIRFRDCEDFFADGYYADTCQTGVLVNQVGDYAGAPFNIVVRGSIGGGDVVGPTSYGIFVPTGVPCSVAGARISNMSGSSAQGVSHQGVGPVVGCTFSDMACKAVDAIGDVTINGCTFARCGVGATSIPAVSVTGKGVVGGNSFYDDRGTPTSTLAIRAYNGSSITVGVNRYGTGITDFVQADVGSTVKRDSSPIRQKFAGVPGSLSGTIEAGVRAVDTNGVMYSYESSAWGRLKAKTVTTTIGITQTTVAHGLGYAPTSVTVTPAADARVWESQAADATNVYLTASASVSCKVSAR